MYRAHYESTFKPLLERVPKQLLKDSAPRRNDQLAIEEVDTEKLLKLLSRRYPATHALLQSFLVTSVLKASEALEEEEPGTSGTDGPPQKDSYESSESDTRRTVERQIKLRRGLTRSRSSPFLHVG